MSVCMCVYEGVCAYVHVHIYVQVYVYMFMSLYMYVHMHVYMSLGVCIYMCAPVQCPYTCIHALWYTYVCMCVCKHTCV